MENQLQLMSRYKNQKPGGTGGIFRLGVKGFIVRYYNN